MGKLRRNEGKVGEELLPFFLPPASLNGRAEVSHQGKSSSLLSAKSLAQNQGVQAGLDLSGP